MELSNELLDEFSDKLGRAVGLTLKLDTDEKIFVGNEERMFLYALIQRFWGTPHVKKRPIKNFIDITKNRRAEINGFFSLTCNGQICCNDVTDSGLKCRK